MLKKIGYLVLIGGFILSLAGCNGNNSKKQVTITVWSPDDDPGVMAPLIKEFEKINPQIKISYQKKGWEEYELGSLRMMAAQKGPDVWAIPSDWVWRNIDKIVPMSTGFFADRTTKKEKKTDLELVKKIFNPVVTNDLVINNKIYGYPLYLDTLALYYNVNIFQDVRGKLLKEKKLSDENYFRQGPSNWNQLVDYVRFLTVRNGNDLTSPAIALGTSDVPYYQDILAALMLQNKTKMTTDDFTAANFQLPATKATGETEYPGIKALEFYTQFARPGNENYTWDPKFGSAEGAFFAGKLPMLIQYGAFEKVLKQMAPTLEYQTSPLPQVQGNQDPIDYGRYLAYVVPLGSPHKTEAWKFIKYFDTKGIALYLKGTKFVGANIVKNPPTMYDRTFKKNPFEFQGLSAQSWHKGAEPMKVDSIFRDMINDVTQKNVPAQTAVNSAATRITELLRTETKKGSN